MQKCRRCGGILVKDVLEEAGIPLHAWHCVVCGDWIDPLILHNRTLTELPAPCHARTTIYDPDLDSIVHESCS